MNTTNQHIYITGSNRGIGMAMARKAAELKNHIYMVNRSQTSEKDIEELNQLGALSIQQIQLDLMDKDSINNFVRELATRRVDIFFNNAGLLTGGLAENQSVDDVYNMIQVNLRAVMHICQGLIPIMLKQKSGYIINNASISGKTFLPCASTYAASKAGVVAFTESIAQELAGTGVQTLLLLTPGVKTRMYDDISNLYGDNLDLDFLDSIPSEEWADKVFSCIKNNQQRCWPSGKAGFGVKLGHHFPGLMAKLVKSRFHRN